MTNKVRHTIHRRSKLNSNYNIKFKEGKGNTQLNVKSPKAPTNDSIEYGELAINYGKGSEAVFMKNDENELIRINSIANIRYDGDDKNGNERIDDSLKKYLDGKYINTSGDTIVGNFKVVNQNYQVVDGAPQYKENDCLGKQIKVIGIQIGDYQTANEKIPVGTPIEKILDNILCKTIGVKKHLPTVTINNNGTAPKTYEVGTVITPKLSHNYTDGYFEGAEDLYIDENTGKKYKISSECTEKENTTKYYRNSTLIKTSGSTNDSYEMKEEDIKYKCTTDYNQSMATPIDTKGNPCTGNSSVINEGTATSATIDYYGRYLYFLGYDKNKSKDFNSDDIRALNAKSYWMTKDSDTTIVGSSSMKSTGGSIVIAIPSTYKLKTIQGGLGNSIMESFKTTETVKVNLAGNAKTDYTAYICPIASNDPKDGIEFKNLVVGK